MDVQINEEPPEEVIEEEDEPSFTPIEKPEEKEYAEEPEEGEESDEWGSVCFLSVCLGLSLFFYSISISLLPFLILSFTIFPLQYVLIN